MATVNVTLYTGAYLDEADPAYELGKRAAYTMVVPINDADQATIDATEGKALSLSGQAASSWAKSVAIDGGYTALSSPPSGLTLSIGPVTPENVATGKRRVSLSSTPPGADHATTWVGWATLGTVWSGVPITAGGDVPEDYSSPGTGLAIMLFSNLSLTGVPTVQRIGDPRWDALANDDATLIPGTGITGGPNLGVSCRGSFKIPTTGDYRFRFSSDDGCRLFLDGAVVIDDWTIGASTRISGLFSFTAGQIVNVRADNFNTGGDGRNRSSFFLDWEINGAPPVAIPESAMYPIGWEAPVLDAPRPNQTAFGVEAVGRYA